MKNKVQPYVDKRIEEHSEKTQEMQAQTLASMQRFHEFQEQMTETIIGKLPPDPEKPCMWQALQSVLGWKKTVNKVLWIAATVAIGAIGGTIWTIIVNSGTQ